MSDISMMTPAYSMNQSQGSSSGMNQSQGGSQQMGVGQSTSQSGTGMVQGMVPLYNQLLGINQQRYGNVMNAYGGAQGNLNNYLPSLYNSYGGLQSDVSNTLGMGAALGQNGNWGIAQPAATAIQQAGDQQRAANTQQMTNAGLGNTTAVANAQDQSTYQQQQALAGLGSQLAQTAAGYQSQLGLAQRSAGMQGLGMQTGLTQAALGPMGQQLSNTLGSLTGSYGTSQSTNQNMGTSFNNSYGTNQSQNSSSGYSVGAQQFQAPGNYGGQQSSSGDPSISSDMGGQAQYGSGYSLPQGPGTGYGYDPTTGGFDTFYVSPPQGGGGGLGGGIGPNPDAPPMQLPGGGWGGMPAQAWGGMPPNNFA